MPSLYWLSLLLFLIFLKRLMLFTFISVIFFTSKMAFNTEIIAILSSGISFKRMLLPYAISGFIIGLISFILTNFVIPNTNKDYFEFNEKYLASERKVRNRNIHMQINPGEHVYVESFDLKNNKARFFSLEKFDDQMNLTHKLTANFATYDTINHSWKLIKWIDKDIKKDTEIISKGESLDTTINLKPFDFSIRQDDLVTMDWWEIRKFIEKEKLKGSNNITAYEVEKHKRIAFPFANIILALIGVAISSRKVRGGIGMHLGIGISLTFGYILFMRVSTVFSTYANFDPLIAAWIPNILFAFITIYLIYKAPK
ncbi:MAG: permease [Bacteroidetes bacterium]|nr:MAG: permease [Bacteroidota bacterium]